jgi:two-component system, chemotaxis family, chemotaxis protein CheY
VSSLPGKILIVEDSPTMCQLYRIVLGRGGTELVFANSGVEGLDQAAREPDTELFIVDINMPHMDGLEFLRRLRTDLGIRDVPAIVISTEGEESDRIAAREAGANAYLRKPWTPDQLLTAVRDVVATEAE